LACRNHDRRDGGIGRQPRKVTTPQQVTSNVDGRFGLAGCHKAEDCRESGGKLYVDGPPSQPSQRIFFALLPDIRLGFPCFMT